MNVNQDRKDTMKEIPEPRWIYLHEAMPPISTLVWGLAETGRCIGNEPHTRVLALVEFSHDDSVQFHWADQDGLRIDEIVLAWWPLPSCTPITFTFS